MNPNIWNALSCYIHNCTVRSCLDCYCSRNKTSQGLFFLFHGSSMDGLPETQLATCGNGLRPKSGRNQIPFKPRIKPSGGVWLRIYASSSSRVFLSFNQLSISVPRVTVAESKACTFLHIQYRILRAHPQRNMGLLSLTDVGCFQIIEITHLSNSKAAEDDEAKTRKTRCIESSKNSKRADLVLQIHNITSRQSEMKRQGSEGPTAFPARRPVSQSTPY